MLLTLSPFAVDSLTPSYRHGQHASPFLSALGQGLLYVPAHPGSRQYLLHAPFTQPSPPPLPLSTCQHHLLLQTVHPHHVSEEQHLLLYVATTGLLAVIPVSLHWMFTVEPILSNLVPPVVVLFLLKMKRIGSQIIISNFFKRPDTRS